MNHNQRNIEDIINNKNQYNFVATGNYKRYKANKTILENDIKFAPVKKLLKNDDYIDETTIVIFCGLMKDCDQKELSSRYKTIDMSQIITYKACIFWNNKGEYIGVDLNHYRSNPEICRYMNDFNSEIKSMEECILKYTEGKTDLVCLSLGCGCGHVERSLAKLNIFKEIHACDISDESLQKARKLAVENGFGELITYFQADLNFDKLPENKYDFVIANICMHHIENLEFAYININKSLSERGIFYQNEYVGDCRFQYGKRLVGAVKTLLKVLPERMKKPNKSCRPKFSDMIKYDPSEAVRSNEIIPLTKKYFKVKEMNRIYSGLMHMFYQCVNPKYFHIENGQPIRNKHRTTFLCRIIFNIEKYFPWLIKNQSCQIIAEKKLG